MSDSTDHRETQSRLKAHFEQAKGTAEHGSKWNELWKEGFVPWDKGVPSPALVDVLTERQDLFPSIPNRRRKALVPGCGRGFDVLLLSAFGYDAYGLEISSNALMEARKVEKEMTGKGVYETKSGVIAGTITWLAGDFFKDDFLKDVDGDGKFDFFYDYTVRSYNQLWPVDLTSAKFLCALPPIVRPAWSKRYSELLSLEGRLVCLEFPTYKSTFDGGPPWALPPKVYTSILPRPGQEMPYNVGDIVESKLGEPTKNGLVCIAHIKPKRTHPIGVDSEGQVTDWIGIWAHPSR
jgi:hypothetical protein